MCCRTASTRNAASSTAYRVCVWSRSSRMTVNQATCDNTSTPMTRTTSRPNSESMGRRILLAIRHEHITPSAHSLDKARRRRVSFEDPAQTPHLHVDTPVGAVVFRTVQQFEQALARQRAHGVIDENLQQCELAARQRERRFVLMKRARLEVEPETPE